VIIPSPGEQLVIDRPTVGRDRIDVTLHRPNENDSARHLAGAGRCYITEKVGPMAAAKIAYGQAAKSANKDNR
jgi:hypothetical protein